MLTGPVAALVYVLVFFGARRAAARRGIALTSSGLGDTYFVYRAALSVIAIFFVAQFAGAAVCDRYPVFREAPVVHAK
jgi:hypothetical protein